MESASYNVLFLCTGNSARSIMAEALLNKVGAGTFYAYSAGSAPVGHVNPFALAVLVRRHYPVHAFRSKGWDEFTGHDGPVMDFVIIVSDGFPADLLPDLPGAPIMLHWHLPEPPSAHGTDAERIAAFSHTYDDLHQRVSNFVSIVVTSFDRDTLGKRLAGLDDQRALRSAV